MQLEIPIEIMIAAAVVDVFLVGATAVWALRYVARRRKHSRIMKRRLADLRAQRILGDNSQLLYGLHRLKIALSRRAHA